VQAEPAAQLPMRQGRYYQTDARSFPKLRATRRGYAPPIFFPQQSFCRLYLGIAPHCR